MLTTNFDYSQLFLFNNETDTATYTNGGGAPVTLAMGTSIGRIVATNKVTPQISSASDGSQDPIGLLAANYTVPAGGSQVVAYVKSGKVDASMVTLGAGDTLATNIVIGGVTFGTLGDRFAAKGILLANQTQINYRDPQ